MRYAEFMNRASGYLTIFVVTQLFSDGLNHLETTLHSLDQNSEKNKRGMNKKGDQTGLPLANSPFNYAVSYWLKHALEVSHGNGEIPLSKELWELVRDLFWSQDGEILAEWLRVFASGHEAWHGSGISKPLNSGLGKYHVSSIDVAASYGLVDIFEWPHPAGVDFDASDKWGYTPLIWAAGSGEEEVVKALLSKHSVRINHTACLASATVECSEGSCGGEGYTALMEATLYSYLGVMKLLLGQPDIELDLVSHGNTALGVAINKGHMKAVELLVGAGAKLAMKDRNVLEIPS
jgi:hypothetical protein